jgi:hypothetical protein
MERQLRAEVTWRVKTQLQSLDMVLHVDGRAYIFKSMPRINMMSICFIIGMLIITALHLVTCQLVDGTIIVREELWVQVKTGQSGGHQT